MKLYSSSLNGKYYQNFKSSKKPKEPDSEKTNESGSQKSVSNPQNTTPLYYKFVPSFLLPSERRPNNELSKKPQTPEKTSRFVPSFLLPSEKRPSNEPPKTSEGTYRDKILSSKLQWVDEDESAQEVLPETVQPSVINDEKFAEEESNQITEQEFIEALNNRMNEPYCDWKINDYPINEKNAKILSKYIERKDLKYLNPDDFSKSLIKEAEITEDPKEKMYLLMNAIDLIPQSKDRYHSYIEDKYGRPLRKEILETALKGTNDPDDENTKIIIFMLGERAKETDETFKYVNNVDPSNINYLVYTRLMEIASQKDIEVLEGYPKGQSVSFVGDYFPKLVQNTESKKEKIYFSQKYMNYVEKGNYVYNKEKLLIIYDNSRKIPELKERAEKNIDKLTYAFFPELEDKNISTETKIKLLQQLYSFKQGLGYIDKPDEYVTSDKIKDILAVIEDKWNHLPQEEVELLKQTTKEIAKNAGKSYEDALEAHFDKDDVPFNIYTKKGDEYLNLLEMAKDKFFTDEEEKIAYEYIECGDSITGGAYVINSALRNDEEIMKTNPILQEEIEGLDRLTKQDETPYDCVVFRAMGGGSHIEEYTKVGNIVEDKGFVSTTPYPGTYTNMFGGRPGGSYIMRIKLPKGTKGCNMKRCKVPYWGNNEEFLLPRNSRFKITEIDEKAKIIEAEYLPPEAIVYNA